MRGFKPFFKSVFPIKDFSGASMLEFVSYEFEAPKFDVEECRQRDLTYAAPLKVTLRLIVFDIDEDTGAKSIKDIKEQNVYMGDMPLMTDNGTFIVNGTERVIVSQMHRSPGVFFDHDKGKSHSSGKLLFAARVIPYRGSWLDIEFDAKDIVHARIDRRRKIPVTSLLMALGMDGEEILDTFYTKSLYQRDGEGWRVPFQPDALKGQKTLADMIDADTGEVVVESGKKLTPRLLRQLQEKGLKALKATDDDLYGNYLAEDVVNFETGEIYLEAVTRSTRRRFRSSFPPASMRSRCSTSTTSISAPISATRFRPTRTRTVRTRCSISTASCVRVSRRPWIRPKPCSMRSSSMPSATISRPSAA